MPSRTDRGAGATRYVPIEFRPAPKEDAPPPLGRKMTKAPVFLTKSPARLPVGQATEFDDGCVEATVITSEVPKSISYGPSKGCGGGVIDEMLNQYAAGRLCTYWCVTQERAAGDQGPRHGESYYHAYEFSSVFVVPSLHTRINPLHVLGSYVHNTPFSCSPRRAHHA